MEDTTQVLGEERPQRGPPLLRRRFPVLRRSDKVLGTCALLLILSGVALKGYGWMRGGFAAGEAPASPHRAGGGALRAGFAPDDLADSASARRSHSLAPRTDSLLPGVERPAGDDLEKENDVWSPALMRGGFGFFAGFAIGLALRTFLRLSTIIVGMNLLLLFGLSYAGWLEVRWDAIELHFDAWGTALAEQFTHFRTFLAGSVPTLGLGSLGVLTGFRRR